MNSNKNYPKVLLISDATWSENNNIGNTFSNLFSDWPKNKIAMIYARPDLPNSKICDNYFQISETRLIKNLINKTIKPGEKVTSVKNENSEEITLDLKRDEESGKRIYGFFTKHRYNIFLILRDILWSIGNWKTRDLDIFINSFEPDIIFSLACSGVYINNLQQYVIKNTKSKAVIYFVDDIYSLKNVSLSPFFLLNKLLMRKSIRKTVELCNLAFMIVQKQKLEYDRYFHINSEVLTKGAIFQGFYALKTDVNSPIKLVFTGNIYAGRWEVLAKIGAALDRINENRQKAVIQIYTHNHLSLNVEKVFKSCRSICFMGGIPASEIKTVQNSADILVHVESLKRREKLMTRLSFSTKLVDYFERGKCIFAVGWNESASIDYLIKNEAAVVVNDLEQIEIRLEELINNHDIISIYGKKAWECGKRNHRTEVIKKKLYDNLNGLLKEDRDEGITN